MERGRSLFFRRTNTMNFHLPKQLSGLSHITYGKRVHPSRDWLIVLVVALLLLVASGLWGTILFIRGAEAEALGESIGNAPSVSGKILEQTSALFEERALEEGRYRNEYRFVDPSL